MSGGGERRRVHSRKQVLRPRWDPAGSGVSYATTPLKNKSQASESEREESKEEEKLGGDRRWWGWSQQRLKMLVLLIVPHLRERERERD